MAIVRAYSLAALAWVVLLLLAAPARGETVQACALNVGGFLRIVEKPSDCRFFERAITLGEPGPQGS